MGESSGYGFTFAFGKRFDGIDNSRGDYEIGFHDFQRLEFFNLVYSAKLPLRMSKNTAHIC